MKRAFRRFSEATSRAMGSSWAFIVAIAIIVIWGVSGPWFGFSNTWQLVVNTGTTIITFLMVFLIQNTQNRDSKAIHLKLDELLRGVHGARTGLVDLESLTDDELDNLQHEFKDLHERILGETRERASEAGAASGAFTGREAGEQAARETARVVEERVERRAEDVAEGVAEETAREAVGAHSSP